MDRNINPTPWPYLLIRLLFKFVLKVFYATIVVENEHFIPKNGVPTLLCANHGNSLTDPLVLVTSISSKKRNFLRLTAKSTLFGKKTFSSWLIESVGSVPIRRRIDNPDGDNDNTAVMEGLMKALDEGDVVCMFPEGMSRFQSSLNPVKNGVAHMASDFLTRHAADPNAELALLTCTITYTHPTRFRSDVLVTFHPPLRLRPSTHPSLVRPSLNTPPPRETIQSLTELIRTQLSSGTIDAPSWEIVRVSKTATRMYAPFGTKMSLGDWVRVVRAFVGGFSGEDHGHGEGNAEGKDKDESIVTKLVADLNDYQRRLDNLGVKDDRIRQSQTHLLTTSRIVPRLLLRIFWFSLLVFFTIPGLALWTPVFAASAWAGHRIKKTGPVKMVWDEIAEQKLLYGLASGIAVYFGTILLAGGPAGRGLLAALIIPLWMWLTLRWIEDLVSTFRAIRALARMLRLFIFSPGVLQEMQGRRQALYERVCAFAVHELGLPTDPEAFFLDRSQKGRVKGNWDAITRYFSITRRRKRDWNEALKWYDLTDFPADDTITSVP
ncbi:hypothetical protein DL93DRAFT_2053699 [Clavulina sp. PMI_390]|nr:hypothetical protein DL93DRAFT_2053699 [Clavulina sp. PMI_390]